MTKSKLFQMKDFLIKRRLSFVLIVFLLLTFLYSFLLYSYKYSSEIVLFESFLLFFSHALFTIILYRIHAFYHSKSAISIVHLSTILFFVSFYLFLIFQYSNLFFAYDEKYEIFVFHSYLLKGIFSFLILLAVANQFWIDKHLIELEKNKHLFIENEKRLIQVELLNLKQQFQPHFLFNSLNSISALIGSEPKEARRMLILLSDFLRQSIRKKENDFELLKDEIAYLKLYLEIEKVRFSHRLKVNVDLENNLNDLKIPSQILQPLLENAIKFGLYGNIGELEISIKIQKLDNFIQIEIENPYDSSSQNLKKGTGFGLSSVTQKLNFLYRRNDLILITKTENTFNVILKIPLV
jgi:sensor histidine kinase YesM